MLAVGFGDGTPAAGFRRTLCWLDLPTKTYLQNLLYGLDQSVLHITHDLQALAEYERVIWLEKGQVVGDGLPKHIIPNFENAMAQIEQI